MKTIKKTFFLAFMAVILNGCLGDSPTYRVENTVLIINEGNFGAAGNGSISYYNELTGAVEPNVLNKNLGAIIQSVAVSSSGEIYVVCNSADKIEIFDAFTGKALGSFNYPDSLSTPRYIAADGSRMFITNWGVGEEIAPKYKIYPNSYVLVIDPNSHQKARKIYCGSDAEELIHLNNKLYVATGEGVLVLDVNANYAKTLIPPPPGVFGGAKSFVLSDGGLLWVSYPDAQKLVAINFLNNNVVEGSYDMPLDWSGKIARNGTGTKIYSFTTEFEAVEPYPPLRGFIHEFDVQTRTKKPTPFFEGVEGSWFYSVGVSPFTGNVYTADVMGFSGDSRLIVLNSSGEIISTDKIVGVGTSGFHFLLFFREE